MNEELADMVNTQRITPEGDVVLVEMIVLDEQLPPRAVVLRNGASNRQHYWVDLLKPVPSEAP